MRSEFERIAELAALFDDAPSAEVSLGIGDDCAVVQLGTGPDGRSNGLVWTIDACIEDVHFRSDIASWADVGWRSLMAAVSDVAAMGARPMGVLSSLALPATLQDDDLLALARGQREACQRVGTFVIGGNLSQGAKVAVHTTCIGSCEAPAVCRSGARPGDLLLLAGQVGWAAAGLRLLLRDGGDWTASNPSEQRAVDAWRRPVARIDAGRRAAGVVHAMIDVSDGVAQDAGHVAADSGVRVVLDPDALRDDELAVLAADLGTTVLDLVLSGGEDYALLATASSGEIPDGFRVIGRCEEGEGVWLEGSGERLDGAGHDHFRR